MSYSNEGSVEKHVFHASQGNDLEALEALLISNEMDINWSNPDTVWLKLNKYRITNCSLERTYSSNCGIFAWLR